MGWRHRRKTRLRRPWYIHGHRWKERPSEPDYCRCSISVSKRFRARVWGFRDKWREIGDRMLAGPRSCLVAALEIPYSKVISKGKVHVAQWRTPTRSIEKIFLDRANHLWSVFHTHANPPPSRAQPVGERCCCGCCLACPKASHPRRLWMAK